MKKCLKKRILPVLAAFVIVITATVLPIGAATVDWSQYPGSNLLPYPYLGFSEQSSVDVNGVNYRLQDYGIVVTSGTANATSIFYFTTSLVMPAGQYYIHSNSADVALSADIYGRDGSYLSSVANGAFTLEAESVLTVYARVVVSGSAVSTVIYPMINRGDVAYPYQPYIPYWMEQEYQAGLQVNGSEESYQAGYDRGYESGYEDGYGDGFANGENVNVLVQSPMDTWTRAEVTVGFINSSISGDEQFRTIPFSREDSENISRFNFLVNGQFSVKEVINFVLDGTELVGNGYILCSSCTLTVYFEEQSFLPALYTFVGKYPSSTTDDISIFRGATVLGSKNVSLLGGGDTGTDLLSYAAAFSSVSGGADKVVFSSVGGTSMDSSHVLEDEGFTLGIVANPNQDAYLQGLRTGSTMGFGNAFDSGKQEGLEEGYQNGFYRGKAEGLQIAELGDWTNLFSAVVDAPVNAFQSLFSFEILGLDMRAFVGSLLTLCLVLLIVKKVIR